jgi:hypothetical protein
VEFTGRFFLTAFYSDLRNGDPTRVYLLKQQVRVLEGESARRKALPLISRSRSGFSEDSLKSGKLRTSELRAAEIPQNKFPRGDQF